MRLSHSSSSALVANRDKPINDTSGVISFKNTKNLVIHGPDKKIPVWLTNVAASGNVFSTQLLDSGNLVVFQGDGKGAIVWQSFDYPTDTLLSLMKLGVDRRTGLNRFPTSWKSRDDPAIVEYSSKMDLIGWAMFGFAVGMLTEYANGSDFLDQVNILLSNFGIVDLDSLFKVKEDDEVDNLDIKFKVRWKTKRAYSYLPPEVALKINTMVPGIKTRQRKTATSGNVLSGSEACPAVIGTPLTLSDETQPPDDTQTVVEETQPGGVGVRMMLHIRRQMKMEIKVVEGGKSAEEDDEDDVAKSVEGSTNGNHTMEGLSDDVDGGGLFKNSGEWGAQEVDDQICTIGYMNSLNGLECGRPNINLEVVLNGAQFEPMTNRPRRVVNSNLSDCIAQSKALSTVGNSAFKDKQHRDGPFQRATARTMRNDDLKMKGTE
ncbi:uncharacterized protein LOC114266109 [Camellia sinensis]|uniref:uncharacterized protein LOC114266109 n=1 Tax=Camellia sinensis TaxID=4442 RepID=UPI00103592EF|nr:uncharacterized protein LOC114266109 [Camellia sinensis]